MPADTTTERAYAGMEAQRETERKRGKLKPVG